VYDIDFPHDVLGFWDIEQERVITENEVEAELSAGNRLTGSIQEKMSAVRLQAAFRGWKQRQVDVDVLEWYDEKSSTLFLVDANEKVVYSYEPPHKVVGAWDADSSQVIAVDHAEEAQSTEGEIITLQDHTEEVRVAVDDREHGSHASTPNGDRKGGLQKQGAGGTTDNELGQVAVITGGDNDVFEDAVRAPSALSESDQASEESDPGSEVSIEVEELTISGKTYLLDRTSGDVYEESSSESPRIIGKWDGRRIVRDDISGANTPAQDGEDSDESTLSVEVQEMEFDGNVYLVDIAAGIVYEDRDEPCAVGSFKNNRIVLHD
jgi:hypothetical protein